MGRLIVNNRSDLSDIQAMEMVIKSMKEGRISNDGKQYCYLMAFYPNGERKDADCYHVVSDLRKGSDSFIVYKEPKPVIPTSE